jgi:hypothetical protein
MWKKQRKSSLPNKWSEDLWNGIFGSSTFQLIVDGYRLTAERSDLTRQLGEPGPRHVTDLSDNESVVNDEFASYGSRSTSSISREYYGRLGHLDASHPASSMHVALSWETMPQNVGAHQWWHWGTALVPRKGVYRYVNPIEGDQYGSAVRLSIKLGTDSSDEAFFEQLFLRSKMSANPLIIYCRIKTIPNQDTRIGLVSEYSIEHYWRS